jgi:cytochrome oxidase Cu insertion factor (SCO1/SenC/PrrC family)
MSDKTKIITIYGLVVLISAVVIGSAMWIRSARKAAFGKAIAVDVGRESPAVLMTLKKDLTATNQEGREVSLSELRGKVWIAMQFFANCPQCAKRNYEDVTKLYAAFRDDPNFHLVCITVDPDTDGVEELQAYAEALDADSSNWWFLTGSREELHAYMGQELKFMDIRERTDPASIAAEGRYAHDLGLEIFGPGWNMLDKADLAFAATQGQAAHDKLYEEVRARITTELNKINE